MLEPMNSSEPTVLTRTVTTLGITPAAAARLTGADSPFRGTLPVVSSPNDSIACSPISTVTLRNVSGSPPTPNTIVTRHNFLRIQDSAFAQGPDGEVLSTEGDGSELTRTLSREATSTSTVELAATSILDSMECADAESSTVQGRVRAMVALHETISSGRTMSSFDGTPALNTLRSSNANNAVETMPVPSMKSSDGERGFLELMAPHDDLTSNAFTTSATVPARTETRPLWQGTSPGSSTEFPVSQRTSSTGSFPSRRLTFANYLPAANAESPSSMASTHSQTGPPGQSSVDCGTTTSEQWVSEDSRAGAERTEASTSSHSSLNDPATKVPRSIWGPRKNRLLPAPTFRNASKLYNTASTPSRLQNHIIGLQALGLTRPARFTRSVVPGTGGPGLGILPDAIERAQTSRPLLGYIFERPQSAMSPLDAPTLVRTSSLDDDMLGRQYRYPGSSGGVARQGRAPPTVRRATMTYFRPPTLAPVVQEANDTLVELSSSNAALSHPLSNPWPSSFLEDGPTSSGISASGLSPQTSQAGTYDDPEAPPPLVRCQSAPERPADLSALLGSPREARVLTSPAHEKGEMDSAVQMWREVEGAGDIAPPGYNTGALAMIRDLQTRMGIRDEEVEWIVQQSEIRTTTEDRVLDGLHSWDRRLAGVRPIDDDDQ